MLLERKLVRATEEQRKEDPRNEIGEDSILEATSGSAAGLIRSVLRLVNVTVKDENNNDQELVVVYSENRSTQYEVDAGGSLKFDEEEGIATFSSRGVQYKIRAIQESDGHYWQVLQNKKRG